MERRLVALAGDWGLWRDFAVRSAGFLPKRRALAAALQRQSFTGLSVIDWIQGSPIVRLLNASTA